MLKPKTWNPKLETCHQSILLEKILPDIAPVSSKEFLDIQATIECGFTLKRVRDMIRTYSQISYI